MHITSSKGWGMKKLTKKGLDQLIENMEFNSISLKNHILSLALNEACKYLAKFTNTCPHYATNYKNEFCSDCFSNELAPEICWKRYLKDKVTK